MICYAKKDISYINPETGLPEICSVRCGKCVSCLIAYSQEWSVRCALENTLHLDSCCVTLTYDDEHLPPSEELVKADPQRFLKRLRKKHDVRYFGCGEYGSRNGRPHYHIIIFGYSFPDRKYFKHTEHGNVYVSSELSRLWPYGFATVGDFSARTAFYCAKYLNKIRPLSEDIKVKPYSMMSIKPSIGFGAVSAKELSRGTVFLNGREYLLPRSFYQSWKRKGVVFDELTEKRRRLIEEQDKEIQEKLTYYSYKKSGELLDKIGFLW